MADIELPPTKPASSIQSTALKILGALVIIGSVVYFIYAFTNRGSQPQSDTTSNPQQQLSPPEGFPKGLPLDANPLKVTKSFVEKSNEADEISTGHTQRTYSYFSSQKFEDIVRQFKDYFAAQGMSVDEYSDALVNSMVAKKGEDYSMSVTARKESEGEVFVTVSIIELELKK